MVAARDPAKAKARNAASADRFEQIPNVGPATAADLRMLGLAHPQDLRGQDPLSLYRRLQTLTKSPQDPCVLDVFLAAVRFMEGAPSRPWWHYTPERKAILSGPRGAAPPGP